MQTKIRAHQKTDLNFILNSWTKSFRSRSRFAKTIPYLTYNQYHSLLIQRILARPTTQCLIVCDTEDPDIVYGYAVFESDTENNIFHYVYIKRAFCHIGLAKKLMEAAPFKINDSVFATHLTGIIHKEDPEGTFCLVKHYKLIHCPYFL